MLLPYSLESIWFLLLEHKHFFLNIFYLFIFRERGREGESEGRKHQCVVASHEPLTGDLAHNPGTYPRLGIELVTLWFSGWHSIHWATLARVNISLYFYILYLVKGCKCTIKFISKILANERYRKYVQIRTLHWAFRLTVRKERQHH